jgi:DNA-binding GntR family transcriptional regulator
LDADIPMSPSLADKAYQLIKDDILSCVLKPGQPIIQMRLAEEYGIGVTPVREALHRLAEAGLVEAVTGVGFAATTITLSDVRQLFELRSVLELAAVRLAVCRATDHSLKALADHASFRYTFHDKSSYMAFLARNHEFHRSIALAGGNGKLADAISRVLEELTRVFYVSLALRDSADEKAHAHLQLVTALRARDMETAEELIQKEIEGTQARVWEAFGGFTGHNVVLSRPLKNEWDYAGIRAEGPDIAGLE